MSNAWLAATIYVFTAVPIFMIAYKSRHEYSWLAFVPIANWWLMCDMADRPAYWVILMMIPYAGAVFYALVWMAIAENTNKPSWLGILMLVPVLSIIVAYYMAFYEPDEIVT